jgi:hypothetical protein
MDFCIGVGVVALTAAATGATHHAATGRAIQARRVVQTAADQLSYRAVSEAWTQMKLGNPAPLDTIRHGVSLRYLATHEEDNAVILTFAGHGRTCVDLVSQPATNAVRTRHC